MQTCTGLDTAPDQGTIHDDYQKVDSLLDAADQSVRQSFESAAVQQADRRAQAVLNLVCNWSINSARDVAWDTALALWQARAHRHGRGSPGRAGWPARVAMASRCLLVAV